MKLSPTRYEVAEFSDEFAGYFVVSNTEVLGWLPIPTKQESD